MLLLWLWNAIRFIASQELHNNPTESHSIQYNWNIVCSPPSPPLYFKLLTFDPYIYLSQYIHIRWNVPCVKSIFWKYFSECSICSTRFIVCDIFIFVLHFWWKLMGNSLCIQIDLYALKICMKLFSPTNTSWQDKILCQRYDNAMKMKLKLKMYMKFVYITTWMYCTTWNTL